MRYTEFPLIRTIDDVLQAVVGRSEFIVAERSWGTVIDYQVTTPDSFDSDTSIDAMIRRECRGIKFAPDGKILARPLHKFFNLGEREETQDATLASAGRFHEKFVIMPKLDGCFDSRTPVLFVDGTTHTMKEVVGKQLSGPIWGMNEITGELVPTEIIGWHINGSTKDWMRIYIRDPHNGHNKRTLYVTPNHEIRTTDGYKEAATLSLQDRVYRVSESLNPIQEQMVLGSLLGDLSVQYQRGHLVQWTHTSKQNALSELKIKILSPLHASVYKERISGYGKNCPLYTVHGGRVFAPIHDLVVSKNGTKTVTEKWLKKIGVIGLAFWYMDDGSKSEGIPTQRPRALLHTEGFTDNEQNLICEWMNTTWGFSPVKQTSKGYTHIRLNADDADAFWRLVAPYIINELHYKLPAEHRNATTFWDDYDFLTGFSVTTVEEKIRCITTWDGRSHRKYDITTGTSNFVANGVVVHNSMIHPILWNEQVHFCTRMGITDVANQALEYIQSGCEPFYMDFCYDLIQSGMTPVFEWCSRKQRIVIDYPQDMLILTAIRRNDTGEYLTRGKMQALSLPYNIPMVDLFDGDWNGIAEFSMHVRNLEGAEGYVLRWDDGNMVKMKGEWYTAIHRAKDSISFEKRVIGLILNDELDDVMPHLLPQDYNRLIAYREDFWKTIHRMVETLDGVVSIARSFTNATGMDERTAKGFFAKNTVSNYKEHMSPWKGLLFSVWDGAFANDCVLAFFRKKFSLDVENSKTNGSQATVDELRAALMLPENKWEDY